MHWATITQVIAAVVAALLLVVPVVGGIIAWGKVSGMQAVVQTLGVSNGELRDENRDLREKVAADKVEHAAERAADKVEFTAQLAAQDAQCKADLAHMRGQIDAFQGGLAEQVVTAVVTKLDERDATKETP